jgi:tetratricopeptide (TPR) repeat protein
LTLRAASGVTTVEFSPDGKTIAAGTFDDSVVLWESAAPASGRERQNGETARKIVDELYQKHSYYYEVIDKLQADKALDEPTRKLALQIANSRKAEDAEKLMREIEEEVMEMVGSPGGDPNAYRVALEKVEKASLMDPNNPKLLVALGMLQSFAGQYKEAIKTLTRANGLEPNEPFILGVLSEVLYRAGRYEDAFKTQAKAHSLEPDMPTFLTIFAEAQYSLGKYEDAVKMLTERLEISRRVLGEQDGSTLYLINQLAWWQATCPAAEARNSAEAVKNATRVCELTEWKKAQYVDTLAAAYAETGDFESAVKWQKKAISLLTKEDPAEWPAEFDGRLKLYESGKPYRESP